MVNLIVFEDYSPGYDELDDYQKILITDNAAKLKQTSEELFVVLEPILYKSSLSFESVIKNYMKSQGFDPAPTIQEIAKEQEKPSDQYSVQKSKLSQDIGISILNMKKKVADTLQQINDPDKSKPLERFQLKKDCITETQESLGELKSKISEITAIDVNFKGYQDILLRMEKSISESNIEDILQELQELQNNLES